MNRGTATRSGLKASQFQNPQYGDIWSAIVAIENREGPFDELAVCDELNKRSQIDEIGGLTAVTDLVVNAAVSSQVPHLVGVVRQAYMDRIYALELSKQLQALQSGTHAEHLISGHTDFLEGMRKSGHREYLSATQGVAAEMQRIRDDIAHPEKMSRRLPLPWGLDAAVPGGWPTHKLGILFAPTGGFKSTVANGLIRHWAQANVGKIVKFGLEDAFILEIQKLMAALSGIPLAKIIERDLSEAELARLERLGAGWLENIVVIDDVVPTPEEMIRAYQGVDGCIAAVYDYAQIIDWEGADERVAMHRLALHTQRAAKRDGVAQVVLSQMREDLQDQADNDNKRPKMQWIFGGSSVYKAAKLIIGVYRPWQFFPRGPESNTDRALYGDWYRGLEPQHQHDEWKRLAELVICKNQLGGINEGLPVLMNLETGEVEEW